MKQPRLLHNKMVLSITEKRFDGSETTYTVRTDNTEGINSIKFAAIQGWEEDLFDPYKKTASWVVMMQFILKMLNPAYGRQGYGLTIGFNGQVFKPVDLAPGEYVNFNSKKPDPNIVDPEVAADPATWITDEEGMDNLRVLDFLANFSNGNAALMAVSLGENDPQHDTDLGDINPVVEVRLSGNFLTFFDYSPKDVLVLKTEIPVNPDVPNIHAIPVKIMWKGHDYFFIRCNQVRGEIEMVTPNEFSQYSNVLAVVPCDGPVANYIYYEVQHVGSKLQVANSSIDCLDISFLDKWGQPLYGIQEYLLELTADFVKLGNLNPDTTMQDIRRM